MTVDDVIAELRALGSDKTKAMLMRNHGVREPCFGVKIGDLKPLRRRIKKDYPLALGLYATGNYDAMVLAGLITDDGQMTEDDLRTWAVEAYGGSLPDYTVAGTAAGSPHGRVLALEWIESADARIASIGWSTLSHLVTITPDADLDVEELQGLLERVERDIQGAPDPVRYTMNGFLIATGCCVAALTDLALATGERIGKVTADLGNNACKVPFAPDYIRKVQKRGTIGKKRKSAKC